MRIDPGSFGRPLPGRKIGRSVQESSSASKARSDQPVQNEPISAETAALVGALHDVPEVRPDVIEEVRQRLQKGEFLSREAAEKTAEAILADLASFIGE